MASTYLTKTFGGAGNRKTWTWSAWIKKAKPSGGDGMNVLSAFASTSDRTEVLLQSSGNFRLLDIASSTNLETSALYRDVSAWYHFVISLDTTQATASDRVKIYVNGEQITSFSSSTYPSLNADLQVNSSITHDIGRTGAYTNEYFDGSMAHVHFIDGLAYDADTFGETDATTGIWKPKTAPSVTYGTNGVFLKMENSGAMGTDSSGNANTFTVNGTMTQTLDTPSNVFATFNPILAMNSTMTLANGNTTGTTGSNYASGASNSWFSTLGATKGKWYAEFKLTALSGLEGGMVGIGYDLSKHQQGTTSSAHNMSNISEGWGYINEGLISNNATTLAGTWSAYTTNDIVGVALDLDNSKLYFSKNGTWQNSGDPTSGATGTGATSITSNQEYFFGISDRSLANTYTYSANFGNGFFGTTAVASAENPDDGIGIFEYDVPAGYRALCTKSINAQEYS